MNIAQLVGWLSKYPPTMEVEIYDHAEEKFVPLLDNQLLVKEIGPEQE